MKPGLASVFLCLLPAAASIQDSQPQDADRKRLDAIRDFVSKNIDSKEKIDEVAKQLDVAAAILARLQLPPEVARPFLLWRDRNTFAILERFVAEADSVKAKDPNNLAAVANAYWKAEESMREKAEWLLLNARGSRYDNVASRVKDLYGGCQGQANLSADIWATSREQGFDAMAPIDLLEDSALTSRPANPRWVSSPRASISRELVVRGKETDANGFGPRAGIVFWGPSGQFTSSAPLTPDVIRNYELVVRFRIISKGFTLLARASTGYSRHAFDCLTPAAKLEIREGNRAANTLNRTNSLGLQSKSAGPTSLPAGVVVVPDPELVVSEGETYEIRERVFGNRLTVERKTEKGWENISDDGLRARYGGIGFQVIPGAEVVFDKIEIKVLN